MTREKQLLVYQFKTSGGQVEYQTERKLRADIDDEVEFNFIDVLREVPSLQSQRCEMFCEETGFVASAIKNENDWKIILMGG